MWGKTPECQPSPDDGGFPDVSAAPPDTRRLIRNRRYCRILSDQSGMPFDTLSLDYAWKALQHDMALVPGGEIRRVCESVVSVPNGFGLASDPDQLIFVEPIYLDRDCVTNADYLRFVQAGGYSNSGHWPDVVLPNVLQFVDSTGAPGPRDWIDGAPSTERLDHPVVGVSWYEASAYATWTGKRLASADEWQRAGTWPKGHSGPGTEMRYPWGNGFDPLKANLWASRRGGTVSVRSLDAGNSPNGVRQLCGNVWEWVDTQFYPNAEPDVSVLLDETMAEVRGGAFDTYFATQASCQFHTGQPLLFRGENVGFRCCITASTLPNCRDASTPTNEVDL